jgi:CHAD domain-containing protein
VEGGDVRAVHAARVASRRLRELLPVLNVDGEGVSKLARRLRVVTSRLGTVREVDVLAILTEELHESGRYDSVALERVKALIAEERARAGHQVGKHLPTAELKRIERKLRRLLDKLEAAESPGDHEHGERAWQWAVEARVARRADALLKAVRSAGALYLPDRLHDVRIGVKKLRYALELSGEITSGRDGDLRLLKRTQDLLGRMHDSQMLIERVRQVQASVGPPELATWRHLDQLIVSLENGCRRLHGRYVRERPALEATCLRLGPKRAALARSSQRQAG